MSNGKSFYYQTSYFKNYFNVYAPDLKGFGQNADMKYPYSLCDYVDEVKEYALSNGLYKPHVIAHSFGGRIAIKLMAEDENFFSKAVLTGCAGLKPKPSLKKMAKKALFNTLKPFVNREKLKGFYSKDYLALKSVMQESFKKIIGEHLDDKLCKIKNQTLIIFGENDKETPLYMAKRLKRGIQNSELFVMKDAGHFCFVDNPFRFNLEVREFLLS